MKKLIFVLIMFLFSCASVPQAANPNNIELVYLGMKFKVPNNHMVIGSMGGIDNFLVFRYGADNGKKYIAFTNMTNDNYICELNIILSDVFTENRNSRFNSNELELFTQTFLTNKEFGEWSNDQHRFFYTIGNKTGSFLFVINKNGKIIKIDSDFLDKEGLYNIVSGYLKTPNE